MTRWEDPGSELGPFLEPGEAEALDEVARRLEAERPLPAPAFRGRLRRELVEGEKGRVAWRPRNVRRLALTYLASGLVLLGIAGAGLAGAGPFTAESDSPQAGSDVARR